MREFLIVCVGALCSLWVAAVNGYPLVFPDTGTYIIQALEFRAQLDRPPFYSLAILPLHATISLWPVIVVQALATTWVTARFLRSIVPEAAERDVLLVLVFAAAATSLPWFSTKVMPDIATPAIVMLVWLMFDPAVAAQGRTLPLMTVGLAGLISLHTASVPFTLGLIAVATALRWRDHAQNRRALGRAALVAIAAVGAALAGQILHTYLIIGGLSPSAAAPFFLLARLIHDGPGREVLLAACPEAGWRLCGLLDRLGAEHNELLWSSEAAFARLTADVGEAAAFAEARAVVAETLRRKPLDVAWHALANSARQFLTISTIDTYCPCDTGRLAAVMRRWFPHELGSFVAARQNTGPWPPAWLAEAHVLVVMLGAAALLAMAFRGPRRGEAAVIAFLALALFGNAVLMGALSGPDPRYQARLVWLVPLVAAAFALRRLRGGAEAER
jgi:hypothetical protein